MVYRSKAAIMQTEEEVMNETTMMEADTLAALDFEPNVDPAVIDKNGTSQRTRGKGLSLQKIIGKLDLISVIATILYYVRLVSNLGDAILYNGSFDYFHAVNVLAQNTGILGIALVSFALFIMISITYFTLKKKARGEISLGKAITLLIWNGVWIAGDAFMLFMVFAVR
jgi:hypothetical protein